MNNIDSLRLNENSFTGTLPTEVGFLSNVAQLWLYQNRHFRGPIPSEVGNMKQLQELKLSSTSIGSTIPEVLYHSLTKLYDLDLHDTELSGTISTWIGLWTNLEILALNATNITGTIPTQLGQLSQLQQVWLDGTMLTGTVPTQLCQLRSTVVPTLLQNLTVNCLGNTLNRPNAIVTCNLTSCCTGCCDGVTGLCTFAY